jgi:hypothetical protein
MHTTVIPSRVDRNQLSFHMTPRQKEADVAASTVVNDFPMPSYSPSPHPVSVLMDAFCDAPLAAQPLFDFLGDLFQKRTFFKGRIVWEPEQDATDILIIETGELLLSLKENDQVHVIETLLPGTMV